jgi:hypothetical protein
VTDWPGFSCVRALTAGEPLTGTWHDRTAEFNPRRRGEHVIPGTFATRYHVHLSPLPTWRGLSPARHRAACADLIAAIEAETRTERADSKRMWEAIASSPSDPHDRPVQSDNRPAPLAHASTERAAAPSVAPYAAFVDAFRAAAAALRRHQQAYFPAGAFPPAAPFVASAAPAGTHGDHGHDTGLKTSTATSCHGLPAPQASSVRTIGPKLRPPTEISVEPEPRRGNSPSANS